MGALAHTQASLSGLCRFCRLCFDIGIQLDAVCFGQHALSWPHIFLMPVLVFTPAHAQNRPERHDVTMLEGFAHKQAKLVRHFFPASSMSWSRDQDTGPVIFLTS